MLVKPNQDKLVKPASIIIATLHNETTHSKSKVVRAICNRDRAHEGLESMSTKPNLSCFIIQHLPTILILGQFYFWETQSGDCL